ncbi:hypothetical protein LR48_Vigan08g054400 [Vigna angularis]|uniref:Uncharacterized protein n=2 Tax=Phaseolus angularis TaxID=3914 RepID=A0A0L9V448_PHAAN|nr:hypothetical protein LR48_Vigan08g054400 [Vigna angularis]BAU03021.1 hypothetical protein VIGAN_UM000500 [Vigna angularis var. angularis]
MCVQQHPASPRPTTRPRSASNPAEEIIEYLEKELHTEIWTSSRVKPRPTKGSGQAHTSSNTSTVQHVEGVHSVQQLMPRPGPGSLGQQHVGFGDGFYLSFNRSTGGWTWEEPAATFIGFFFFEHFSICRNE